MQLSKLFEVQTQKLSLKHFFTGEDTPIEFEIYPKNSRIGKKAEHEMRMQTLSLLQDENNIDQTTKNLKTELIEDISFNYLSSLVVDWKGITNDKEKPIKYSKDECIKIFKEYPEICDLVYRFVEDNSNFQKVQNQS